MGNLVTFSVRHDLMHTIGSDRFQDLSDLMNEPDNQVKTYQAETCWEPGFTHISALTGVACSQYHHSEDHCDLLVSNQWLTLLPWGLKLVKHRQPSPYASAYPPELAQKALRSLVKEHPDRKLQPSTRPLQKNAVRSAFTVFGFKTDYCHDLEKKPDLMAHILQHCRTGQANKGINDRDFRIESLGTFNADTSVVVTMSRGAFSVIPVAYAPLEVSPEHQVAIINQQFQSGYRNRLMDRAKIRALSGGLGLDLVAKNVVQEQEAAWAPR
ncbi:hypothetical protein RBE51_21785 [Pseudomonas taiwanensis]|uniref:hypothetical protein n=1 Tax=Pseudomonas taiwanensis TaxID=470150 RepID=UPI0028DDFE65|nr:hypothetical protein [Pseudomonas taiwanensis]MDT8925431.1 hypothetical protein [Pseudomonas taiwanensis]